MRRGPVARRRGGLAIGRRRFRDGDRDRPADGARLEREVETVLPGGPGSRCLAPVVVGETDDGEMARPLRRGLTTSSGCSEPSAFIRTRATRLDLVSKRCVDADQAQVVALGDRDRRGQCGPSLARRGRLAGDDRPIRRCRRSGRARRRTRLGVAVPRRCASRTRTTTRCRPATAPSAARFVDAERPGSRSRRRHRTASDCPASGCAATVSARDGTAASGGPRRGSPTA